VVFGPKRYVKFRILADGSLGVVDHTRHVIGALAAPPSSGKRRARCHDFTTDVASVLTRAALAGDDSVLPPFAWEAESPGFPGLRRIAISGPGLLARMPRELGLHPGARIVEGIADHDRTGPKPHPVAPDPGGTLQCWRHLAWHDTTTAQLVGVCTDWREAPTGNSVVLQSLRSRAVAWGAYTPHSGAGPIVIDPLLIRRVGRPTGAFNDGTPQAVHADIDPRPVLARAARVLGASRFAHLAGLKPRTARALAAGRLPKPSTVASALAGLVNALGADPLPALLDLVESSRRMCVAPGCTNPARRRSTTCSEAHRKRAARAPIMAPANDREAWAELACPRCGVLAIGDATCDCKAA
jgi:hypothetical protein